MSAAFPGSNVGRLATLVFLNSLHECSTGDKVRFLGCVQGYDSSNATLTLAHPPNTRRIAAVDISTPLPLLDMGSLRDGEWLNIIGDITRQEEIAQSDRMVVHVDAVTVWPAKGLNLAKYEFALRARQGL